MTKAQAGAALLDFAVQVRLSGHARVGGAISMQQLVLAYFESKSEFGDATIRTNSATTGLMVEHFGADREAASIGRAEAGGFRDFVAGRSKTPATLRRHLAVAKQVFAWAVDRDILPSSPFDRIKLGRVHAQEHWEYVPVGALPAIFEHCPNPSWVLAFALARWAGLRANEIERCLWSWVDMDRRVIRVEPSRGVRTTKQGYRSVPICPELWERLNAVREREGLVCPELGACVSRDARRILAAAGCSWPKPLHTLRKSLESDWLSQHPIPAVCAWMGHDAGVAMRHYHKVLGDTIGRVTEQANAQ